MLATLPTLLLVVEGCYKATVLSLKDSVLSSNRKDRVYKLLYLLAFLLAYCLLN